MSETSYYVYTDAKVQVGEMAEDSSAEALDHAIDHFEQNGGVLVVGESKADVATVLAENPHDGADIYMQNRRGTITDARLPYFSLEDMRYVALADEDAPKAAKITSELACLLLVNAQDRRAHFQQPDIALFMKDAKLRVNQRTIQDFAEYTARSQSTRRSMTTGAQRLLIEMASYNNAPFEIDESETLGYVEYLRDEPYVSIAALKNTILKRGYINDAPNTSLGLLSPICQFVLAGYAEEPAPTAVKELVANKDVYVNRHYILEQGIEILSAGVESVRTQVFVDALRRLPPIAYSGIVGDQYLTEVSYTTKYIAARVASGLVQAGLAK